MNEEYNALFEGCDHDTPSRLQIACMKVNIHSSIQQVAFRGTKRSYDLYGTTKNFRTFAPYEGVYENRQELDTNLHWCFEAVRSICLRDGRIFVDQLYIKDSMWQWYLAGGLPDIIDSMRGVFVDGKQAEEINEKGIRLF